MKVLLLGSKGMLGKSIAREFGAHADIEFHTAARVDAEYNFDFNDELQLRACIYSAKPDVIINAAAVVNIAWCENDRKLAYEINGRFPGIVGEVCKEIGCYFIQVSTDHYYSGDKDIAHTESDDISILNEYARSKYIGEELTLLNSGSLVVRTNIVGFKNDQFNKTFLEWCISSLTEGVHMKLFDDFYTSSMTTTELARVLKDIIYIRPSGILNIASRNVLSKKDFVLLLAKKLFNKEPDYEIAHVNDEMDIRRGDSLGLDVKKAEKILGYMLPEIEEVMCDKKTEYERIC